MQRESETERENVPLAVCSYAWAQRIAQRERESETETENVPFAGCCKAEGETICVRDIFYMFEAVQVSNYR